MYGVSRGKEIFQNRRQGLAPSTWAASWYSLGMLFNPARKISIIVPQTQMINSTTDILDHMGLSTHNGTRLAAGSPAAQTLLNRVKLLLLIPKKKALKSSWMKIKARSTYPVGGITLTTNRINWLMMPVPPLSIKRQHNSTAVLKPRITGR